MSHPNLKQRNRTVATVVSTEIQTSSDTVTVMLSSLFDCLFPLSHSVIPHKSDSDLNVSQCYSS